MTLAEYINSRREFDNMTTARIWTALLGRGKIKDTATLKEIEDACKEARRLYDMYLR